MALFYIFVYTFLPVFHSLWFWTPDFHWGSSTSTPLPLLLCLMAGWRSLSVYRTVPSRVWGTVTATFSAGETSLALPEVSLHFSPFETYVNDTQHISSLVCHSHHQGGCFTMNTMLQITRHCPHHCSLVFQFHSSHSCLYISLPAVLVVLHSRVSFQQPWYCWKQDMYFFLSKALFGCASLKTYTFNGQLMNSISFI